MADKVRAQTLQQRFGFQDKELTTPAHDQIMIWLNENIAEVVASLTPNEWSEKDIEWAHRYSEDPQIPVYPGTPLKVQNVKWEYPIVSRNEHTQQAYTIGFIDMAVKVVRPTLDLNRGQICAGQSLHNLFFEVKPSIPSLGELIRQIQMYRTYEGGTYIVVSPDDRWAPLLQSQGIRHVKCPAF